MRAGPGHARTLALTPGMHHMILSIINTALTFIGHTVGTMGAKW
jgi:hypothetical protein